MKKDEVAIGGVYRAKVTDRVVEVRIDAENPHGGWDATNLVTGKKIRIKSSQRLRGKVKGKTKAKSATRKKPSPKPKRGARAKGKMSGLDAAAKVLAEVGTSMSATQMTEMAVAKGYWAPDGKTPAATLYSAIVRELQKKGDQARFRKVERGLFMLKTS